MRRCSRRVSPQRALHPRLSQGWELRCGSSNGTGYCSSSNLAGAKATREGFDDEQSSGSLSLRMDSWLKWRRPTCHSSQISSRTLPASRRTEASSGKTPTTLLRRLTP